MAFFRAFWWCLAWLALTACQVVDTRPFDFYGCDSEGRCSGLDAGDQPLDAGVDAGDAALALDAGFVDAGVAIDAGVTCGPSNCTGCCDSNNLCQPGGQDTACGLSGASCVTCNAGCLHCGSAGQCVVVTQGTETSSCAPFVCDGVSRACPTSCTANRNCVTGRYCRDTRCELLLLQGATCQLGTQCRSSFCSDKVCCDSECSNACDRCNATGLVGLCVPSEASSAGSPMCPGAGTCNGSTTSCPPLCATGCPVGTFCSGLICVPRYSTGTACTAAEQCASGFCSNTTCCNSACELSVCSPGGSSPAITTTFRNKFIDRSLLLYWVDPTCAEIAAGDLPPRSNLTLSTSVGHVFRARNKATGVLVEAVPPLTATTTLVGVPSDGTAPVCSDDALAAATLTVQNNFASKSVSVFWVDYQCHEQAGPTIAPGGSTTIDTYFTHAFRVRDSNNSILIFSTPALSSPATTVVVP